MHVTGRRNKFTKLEAINILSYMGTCYLLLLSVLTVLTVRAHGLFQSTVVVDVPLHLEHDFICRLPTDRYNFPCSS